MFLLNKFFIFPINKKGNKNIFIISLNFIPRLNIKNVIVRQGDYINSNSQVANVSESNNPDISNSHYLHFEIWKDESKLNPELWIKKK